MTQVSFNEPSCEAPSPFANLNGRFAESNEMLSRTVDRLRNKLHKLSDTNFPSTNNSDVKEVLPDLPFRDGHMMDYFYKLNNYSDLINQLIIQVEKVESLI